MLFSETIDPVHRSKDSELFLIRMEAEPMEDNPESEEFGGAFVNAWVNVPTLREAEERTIAAIQEDGWHPTRFDHWELVCRDCYTASKHDPEDLPELLEMVDTAFANGISFAFYTWPV